MKDYYVLWTYIANHSNLMKVPANTPMEARQEFCGFFGSEFIDKATILVFETPPALIMYRGEVVDYDTYQAKIRQKR